jgi:hypothetical protein
MQITPHYVYIFRRIKEVDGLPIVTETAVVRSRTPLDAPQLALKLADVAGYPVSEYQLLDPADDVSFTIDTWEHGIETCGPAQSLDVPVWQLLKPPGYWPVQLVHTGFAGLDAPLSFEQSPLHESSQILQGVKASGLLASEVAA